MKRHDQKVTADAKAADVATVQRIVALIGKSYAERITLKTVGAALGGLPRSHGRLFIEVVGIAFHEYLTRVRLQHATHLIANGAKIEAVALSVGYRSKKNFYRQFTRLFGVTPDKFRRSPQLLTSSTHATSTLRFAGPIVGARGHICAFFASPEEEYRLLLPFIKAGFDRGDRIFHVVDPRRFDEHVERLEAAGIAVAAAREHGQFTLREWSEAYFTDGRFDQQRMLALWKDVTEAADLHGLPRTRLIAHMEWSLEDRDGVDEVLEYEARYNLIHDDRDTVICVYDLNKYSGAMLMDVLRTHPTIMVDGILQDNLLYVPPELFLGELRARKESRQD